MDGIIIVNKHKGCTSHDIVYKVKKMVHEKVGHTGTLDPMATGVLPLLIGKGTGCAKYFNNHDKEYKVKLQLGQKTDTADIEGKVIEEKNVEKSMLEEKIVIDVLNQFLGKQEQVPPIYSAIKVNGKKLYEYARKGESVEIKPRQIEIYEIKLLEIEKQEKQIEFTVKCSKGTYIRSLCEDIATKLNTVGHMIGLERLQVGEFNIKDAVSIKELEEAQGGIEQTGDMSILENYVLTIEKLFENYPSVELSSKKLQLLLNGVKLSTEQNDGVYKVYSDKQFIGIATVENDKLKRDIIL